MVTKYTYTPADPSQCAKASGSHLRVSYKNTSETANAIKNMTLKQAERYLDAVKNHQRCIPFRRYKGSIGRTGQAKEFGVTTGRWPVKSVELIQGLLQNAASNAESKNLDLETLVIKHIQVNQAPKMRRRTYRAHGRINPYQSSPCHVELVLAPGKVQVEKAAETEQKAVVLSKRRQAAKQRLLARK